MEIFIFGLILIAIIVIFIVNYYKQYENETNELTGSVNNHDDYLSDFVFISDKTKDEIIGILNSHNESDVLKYDFIPAENKLVFKKYGETKQVYLLTFTQRDDGTLLRLTKENSTNLSAQNTICHYINKFTIKKLGVRAIPYFK